MQGTVFSFDAESRCGSVVLDDGVELSFPAAALESSGLRFLRPGQRVRLDVSEADPTRVVRVQILTLPG